MALLLILLLLVAYATSSVPIEGFGTPEDGSLRCDDDCSGRESLSPDCFFYGHSVGSLTVYPNGVLQFDAVVPPMIEGQDPVSEQLLLICPFWTDQDTQFGVSSGIIYYRSMNLADFDLFGPHIDPTLSRADFDYGFVATFSMVQGYGGSAQNTYQVLYMKRKSGECFVVMNYGSMNWDGYWSTTVGFSGGEGVGLRINDQATYSLASYLSENSNVDLPGRWVYRVDGNHILNGSSVNLVPSAKTMGAVIGGAVGGSVFVVLVVVIVVVVVGCIVVSKRQRVLQGAEENVGLEPQKPSAVAIPDERLMQVYVMGPSGLLVPAFVSSMIFSPRRACALAEDRTSSVVVGGDVVEEGGVGVVPSGDLDRSLLATLPDDEEDEGESEEDLEEEGEWEEDWEEEGESEEDWEEEEEEKEGE